jgi:hypothetical protein
MHHQGRIALGLKAYLNTTSPYSPKPPEQLVNEVQMALSSMSNGFMIFDLNNTSDEELRALANLVDNLP